MLIDKLKNVSYNLINTNAPNKIWCIFLPMEGFMFDKLFSTMTFKSKFDRMKLEEMFNSYMENIPENFYKNQFDLAKAYPGTDYADWVRILRHPAFDTWKAEQIAIIATTSTDRALAGGEDVNEKNALTLLKMRQEVLSNEKKVEKPTVIVIPESLFFKKEDRK